jgi:HEAT repeat protein
MDDKKKLIKALVNKLMDNDPDVRANAAQELGKTKDPSVIPFLKNALEDEHWYVRSYAASSLQVVAGVDAVPHLLQALENEKSATGWMNIATILGEIGLTELQLQDILENLNNDKWEERHRTVIIIGKIGDRRAIPSLISAYEEDKNRKVRETIAELLGIFGEITAVPALVKSLNQSSVNLSAIDSLHRIFGHCDSIENVLQFEREFQKANEQVKCMKMNKSSDILFREIAKLKMAIAQKKNELTGKQDILVKGFPKPPKRSKIYQQLRRIRNA